ncbi:ankyrin repeat domain-containing protein [Luteimonas sp. RD2P54]|uniref:Ankyrin repeat domain-containing protein n=1 Tax=Luteimonas endophytica TaxID=3042023 RepID=A0ABT6JCH8_9GAMM|nr:ankyrin repeat domain-containing protein [Luteimonas endophytica]MDH5824531.1 ankyrin repeat domain-containing protein [Luteimonas endophytica]
MPDPQRPRRRAALAFVSGAVLSLIAGFGGAAAALGLGLAQPAFALAVRWWRGGDAPADAGALRRDLSALLALWSGALALSAVLVAWPLSALRQSGSLGAAVGLSAMTGICVVALWRLWPFWHALERDGGGLAAQWRRLADHDPAAGRGAVLALCVAAVLAAAIAMAWPGLLVAPVRWSLAVAGLLLWPLAHWLLQRLPAPAALPMPVVEMPGVAAEPGPVPPPGDPEGELYLAARGGRVDRALELLDLGADPHALPAPGERDQRSLAVLAAVLPDLRLLRALIARGADLNAAHAGLTPLLAATRDSWHGRPEAVMTLLANGADPRACDAEGNTPLHHAARSSDPGVAALLRDAAAELDAVNGDGLTPLGTACAVGNWRLARFLLERGARAEVDGATPALLAAAGGEEDDTAGVQLLLRHKAKPSSCDRGGRSALHAAAFAGHAEIVAALIAAGADVQARDHQGRTPLLEAARGARLATLEALAAARAETGAVDAAGRSALVLACQGDTPSAPLVQRLLELGVDPQLADAEGRLAVEHAAAAGRWSLVALLDPGYALPASILPEGGGDAPVPDRAPLSLLRDGLREGRLEGLAPLLPLLGPRELGGLLLDEQAPLSVERIDWLLAHGADPEVRDGLGDSAIFRLLAKGPDAIDALQAMLRRNVSPAGAGGLARFLAACARSEQAGRGLEQLALELLERGADPFAPSTEGDPPLALAVRLGWGRLLERLVAVGVDLDARDSRGMTALHLCAALGREAALKTLVRHGAAPDVRAADGQTPLGVALSGGRRDLADWLDWRGWTLPRRALRADDLPAAAIVGDADAVRRLLDLGFRVDTPDAQGCTALLRAAGGGHRATVDLLLARGADPQLAAHTGATALSAAVSMRQGEIVDRLLDAGAGLEQRLPGEVTVLMLAAALGLPDLCARLLTAGANVHATDAQGLGPLHCAALYGFTCRDRPRLLALFDTLLLAGADVDAAAAGGVTPLLLLLGARAEPGTACDEEVVLGVLDYLLDEEVSLEAQDPRGFGPLHLAALHGLLQLTRRLLRAGADPDLRDALNRTPREIAVMRGFVDVAAEFAPAQSQPGVSMARFLREPR